MSESIEMESKESKRPESPRRRYREVPQPSGVTGRLFLDEMPGRNWPIEDAWASIKAERVSCIVCLAPDREIMEKSPTYGRAIARGEVPCERIVFPIADFSVPRDETAVRALAETVAARLRAGERILVHCAAGRGRSGMFAMFVLLVQGVSRDEARDAVAEATAGPETEVQESFVRKFARDTEEED